MPTLQDFDTAFDALEAVIAAVPTVDVAADMANIKARVRTAIDTITLSGSWTSPAAAIELPGLLSGAAKFPQQWEWDGTLTQLQPRAATPEDGLTPKIEQYRDGVLIATWAHFASDPATSIIADHSKWPTAAEPASSPSYIAKAAASGAGPFGSLPTYDTFRFYQDGDEFRVYPAVYTGVVNNIAVIDGKRDFYADTATHIPTNIKIVGVTENGIRPVLYWDSAARQGDNPASKGPIFARHAKDTVIENLDLQKGPNGLIGKAGVYLYGIDGFTLRNMRIHGFADHTNQRYGENGVFSTLPSSGGDCHGTLLLERVELFDNGGADGPAHNMYINESSDPDWTLRLVNCWSHRAFTSHLVKSRAQNTIVEGCYLQGGVPDPVFGVADNWILDVPDGGNLTVRNCIFAKNASGKGSNGASVTFLVDHMAATQTGLKTRKHSVTIENNTFVGFSLTYDGGHPIWPFFFRDNAVPTGDSVTFADIPDPIPVSVRNNIFVGYPHQAYAQRAYMNYRGDDYVELAFAEIGADFAPLIKYQPAEDDAKIIGTPAYVHEALSGVRAASTVGAMD